MKFTNWIRILAVASLPMLGPTLAPIAKAHGVARSVSGWVLAESPTPDAVRCAWMQQGEQSQGVIGWVVELLPHEGEGDHDYALYTKGVAANLGVAFFGDLGTCTSAPPELARNSHWSGWSAEDGFIKSGRVPAGARYAVLGHWAPGAGGPNYALPPFQAWTGAGAAAAFTFTVSR